MSMRSSSRFLATLAILATAPFANAQDKQSSSSSTGKPGQSSSSNGNVPAFAREKAPSLVDPAGPAISLVNSETLFTMAAALNTCGYNDGLEESDALRLKVRNELDKALAASEEARTKRDDVCHYIAQHKTTGTIKDVNQYISLALYLTPPPALETSVELPEMPPDSTQVVEILPFLRDFAAATDLHGIWVTNRRAYDEVVNRLHDSLTQMIVNTNFYLKMPASTYDGRRFLVVVEPQLSPRAINARIYGADYVVVVSPTNKPAPAEGATAAQAAASQIRMGEIRHTYLHYLIEPLLYQRASAMDRFLPILKEVREAPLEYRYRSDIVELTIESLIKAIEARTMDTGIAPYVVPKDAKREDFEKIAHDRGVVQQKQEQVRVAHVRHEMAQGYVLTAYFYEQLGSFEKDPASLKDTIGELVYGMDVDHEQHRARAVTFDAQADDDVLLRTAPRKLTGLDLAEARLAAGDYATAASLARQSLVMESKPGSVDRVAESGRANFILARVAILTKHPQEAVDGFQKAAATAKETRILAWSHIYLGRIADLNCKRTDAIEEYKEALAVRDGQQDTRIAAERGVKTAFAVQGHVCEAGSEGDKDEDNGSDTPDDSKEKEDPKVPAPAPPTAPPSTPK
jgi:tetratricopeptide (TPR) repeat protein